MGFPPSSHLPFDNMNLLLTLGKVELATLKRPTLPTIKTTYHEMGKSILYT